MGLQMRIALAALIVVVSGPAFAFGGGGGGGSGGGDGLNPYAELSGNGRTGGVNSGPYNPPAYNTYLRAYGPDGPGSRRVRNPDRYAPRPYYGYPY
ncbi:hypothetical protein [Methylobacterium symbioticum]|jgi:hypothetical protein|uniref:Uncharacterized protein n=1 Tax=Methylobacterium symbioticum TaxID=2584084 RepID=A0A509E740_9HYPH|nr:hypothetical protein [Methylobacterium symbioticum]VUD69948.1 hypothetical protein MET9862_00509 [Methylobacterium symbioticum]